MDSEEPGESVDPADSVSTDSSAIDRPAADSPAADPPAADPSAAVELDGVTLRYGATTAVDTVDLAVRDGEFFTLVGPSGCGKTSTLRLIAGFETPTEGVIRFDGRDVAGVPPEDRNVGVVFQNYALFPHLTVAENIAYGLQFTDPPGGVSRADRVQELLDLVDLPDAGDRDPEHLSGGQRQRVAMARALAPGPDLLLLDEPMSALDAQLRERLRVQIRAIQRELDITTIYVTHDQAEALAISDRVAVMRAGRPEQVAPPRTVYHQPISRFVAEFVGDNNLFEGRIVEIHESAAGDDDAAVDANTNVDNADANVDNADANANTNVDNADANVDNADANADTNVDNADADANADVNVDNANANADTNAATTETDHPVPTPQSPDFPRETKGVDSAVAVVDVDGERLHVAIDTTAVAVGDPITFCVRPEHLRLGDGLNAMHATVESAEFLGATTRVHLDWAGRSVVLRTTADVSGDVVVGFEPTAAHVVTYQ